MKRNLSFVFFFVILTQCAVAQVVSLEDVVKLALEKNYDIQLVRNTASAAETDNQYAFGGFLPQLNGTASKNWSVQNQKQVLFDAAHDSTIHNIKNGVPSSNTQASIQLTWTLFDGTKMFATRRRLEETATQGQMLLKNQMTNSIASVIANYYNIVRQKQQLKAIHEQMAVSEERVKLAERKLEVGTGIKPELLQAKVDLNAFRTQALQQETIIGQLKDQLNGLVGMQLPNAYEVSDSILIDLNVQREEIESNIENSNYALQAFSRSVAIAKLAVRERRGDLFPVINFVSNYNFQRTDNKVAVSIISPLLNQNQGYNYGFTMSVPILQGFNRRRLVQQAKLTYNYQSLYYEQQKIVVAVQLRNAFTAYDNAKKILNVQEENIGVAKENVFVALEGFKRGATTFIELRTAQQSLADAYNSLILARYNAKVAETELFRISGRLLQ
jgi:outer membrane protein TolC